jgi:molecular chaperone HscB
MQPLLKQNFFELFGLSPGYSIDISDLALRYRELQQVVHPDRYASASEQERRLSMQCAAHVNEAFQTLKHPLSRARYLLELRGVAVDQSTTMPTEFLLEQMTLREQLEDLSNESDPLATLMQLRDDVEQRIRDLQHTFADLLTLDDNGDAMSALQVFNKLQFLYRLQEEFDAQEEQLAG